MLNFLPRSRLTRLTNDHRLVTRFWGHGEYRKNIHVLVKQRGVVSGQRSYLVNVYKRRGLNDVHGRSTVDMFGKIVLILSALVLVKAQIPSLGFCPDYIPMANFDMNKVNMIDQTS